MATKGRVADIRNKFAIRGSESTTGSSSSSRVNGGGNRTSNGTTVAPVSVKENIARYQQQLPLSAQLSRHQSAPQSKHYQETDIDADVIAGNYSSADRSHFTRAPSTGVVPPASVRLGTYELRGKSAPITPRRRTDDVTSGTTYAVQTGNGKPVSANGSGTRPYGMDLTRSVLQQDRISYDARNRPDVTASVGNWIENLSTPPAADVDGRPGADIMPWMTVSDSSAAVLTRSPPSSPCRVSRSKRSSSVEPTSTSPPPPSYQTAVAASPTTSGRSSWLQSAGHPSASAFDFSYGTLTRHHRRGPANVTGNGSGDNDSRTISSPRLQQQRIGRSKFDETDEERLAPLSSTCSPSTLTRGQQCNGGIYSTAAGLPVFNDAIVAPPYATLRRNQGSKGAARQRQRMHAHSRLSTGEGDNCSICSNVSTSPAVNDVQDAKLTEIQQLRQDLDWAKKQVAFLTTNLNTNVSALRVFDQTLSKLADRLQTLNVERQSQPGTVNSSDLSQLLDDVQWLRNGNSAVLNEFDVESNVGVWSRKPGSSTNPGSYSHPAGSRQSYQLNGSASLSRHPSLLRDSNMSNYPEILRSSTVSLCSQTSPDQTSQSSTSSRPHSGLKSWLKSSIGKAFSRKKSSASDTSSTTSDTKRLLPAPSLQSVDDRRQQQPRNSSGPTMPSAGVSSPSYPPSSAPVADYNCATVGRHRKWPSTSPVYGGVTNTNGTVNGTKPPYYRSQTALPGADDFESRDRYGRQQTTMTPYDWSQQFETTASPVTSSTQRETRTQNVPVPAGRCTSMYEAPATSSLMDLLLKANDRRQVVSGRKLTVSVAVTEDILPSDHVTQRIPMHDVIGSCRLQPSTDWETLDATIQRVFKSHLQRLDPSTSLGLNSDSILAYTVGEMTRRFGEPPPELLPIGYMVGEVNGILITLKGDNEFCLDQLVFETLVAKTTLHRYVSLLYDHRRLVLHGSSGTGKSYMALKLAQCIVRRSKAPLTADSIALMTSEMSVSANSTFYEMAQRHTLPTVVILDDVTPTSLVDGSLFADVPCLESSYIIATMSQTPIDSQSSGSSNGGCSSSRFHAIHYANQLEPVHGFLGRYMRRRLAAAGTELNSPTSSSSFSDLSRVIEWLPKVWHKVNKYLDVLSPSADITIGPKLFLACPMDVAKSLVWFTDLWNYFVVPYLSEAVRQSMQLHLIKSAESCRVRWLDLADWMTDSWPWPTRRTSSSGGGGGAGGGGSDAGNRNPGTILRLRCSDVGFEDAVTMSQQNGETADATSSMPRNEAVTSADNTTSQSSATVSDPLMSILAKLQDTAAENASDSDSTIDAATISRR